MQCTSRLNLEQFALATWLIAQKVSRGVDPPTKLEANMIPPSMRAGMLPPTTLHLLGGIIIQDPELLKSPEIAQLITEIDLLKAFAPLFFLFFFFFCFPFTMSL